MSTPAEIIQAAFREANYTAAGESPTPQEVLEALPRLQNLVSSIFGFELGELLREWYVPRRAVLNAPVRQTFTPSGEAAATSIPWAYPPPNSRIIAKVAADATLYFSEQPNDGARMSFVDVGSTGAVTLDGNGRLIEGATTIVDPPSGSQWLYRADLADWILLSAPEMDEQMPLPPEFDDLWICGLAIRLAPRFGIKELEPQVVGRFSDMLSKAKQRYKQTEAMPVATKLSDFPTSFMGT